MILDIKHTNVFSRTLEAINSNKRLIISQGGSRSSKTYSTLQVLIFLCLTTKTEVSIVRKSFPSLRGSVMRDFIRIMNDLNLYNVKNHNKTEHRYTFTNGSSIEFFSVDDAQKVRGRKRDIAYLNEANELSFEDYQQIALRTSSHLIMDFNPSDNDHFLYDLLKDERSILIKSTYKDNIFLEPELVKEIENLINVDENYYRIYALGERPISNTRIYTHFKTTNDIPYGETVYGLDFGYNDPCVLIRATFSGGKVYVEELIYRSYLTAPELIKMTKEHIKDNSIIWCDSSRPEIIEEMKRAGLNAKGADKAIRAGIDSVKSIEIFVSADSINILKEYKMYSWKSKGDIIFDEPIDLDNHAMDAMRYAIHSNKKKPTGKYAVYSR